MESLQKELKNLEEDQRKNIMNILKENHHMSHEKLIYLANSAVEEFKNHNERKH
jgi:hypothetical protein